MKLGFPAIDEDHERLLSLVSEVEGLIASGSPIHQIRAKFHELVVYSLGHFGREEAHMKACRYPALSAHRREHLELAEWLIHIDEAVAEDGRNANAAAIEQILVLFQAWIGRHLALLDTPAVRFMLSASEASSTPTASHSVPARIRKSHDGISIRWTPQRCHQQIGWQ